MISIFLLSACSNVEKVQHIEVFVSETPEQNNEGFFETTGYKKIGITTVPGIHLETNNNNLLSKCLLT